MYIKQVRKRRSTAKKAKKVSAPIKQAIVKAVRSVNRPEVKFATLWNGQFSTADTYGVQFNAAIGTGTNYELIPRIPQGVDVGQRIGAKINPKRLVVDFIVNATNYVSAVDMIARIFILESRSFPDGATINSVDMSKLLDYGQAVGAFQGYPSNMHAKVNTDQFKVHMDRCLKVQKAYGQGPNLANAYNGGITQPQIQHRFRVVLKCPKVLHYREASNDLPDGWGPFLNAAYVIPSMTNVDGTDLSNTRLQVSWNSTLYYTDV